MAATAKFKKDDLVAMYRKMYLIRVFEETSAEMYTKGKIGGFLHLYSGEEAVGVGIISALREDDYVIGAYREHGQCIAKGTDPKYVMAELFGKSTGISKGKGGSMHMFDVERGFLGGHGIVGGGMPIAAGVGMAINYKKTDQVVANFFGDGAVNEGAFHEALNLAVLWNLPVIYILENNMYGMGTAVKRASAIPDLVVRVCSYGIEHIKVDGMDAMAVREVAEEVIKRVRKDKKPRFIEAVTYRFRGHSMSDPDKYRTREEVEEWKEKDPIPRMEAYLKKNHGMKESDFKKIRADVEAEVKSAVDFAEESPFPAQEALLEDIYA